MGHQHRFAGVVSESGRPPAPDPADADRLVWVGPENETARAVARFAQVALG
jgi:hypothetical protein